MCQLVVMLLLSTGGTANHIKGCFQGLCSLSLMFFSMRFGSFYQQDEITKKKLLGKTTERLHAQWLSE